MTTRRAFRRLLLAALLSPVLLQAQSSMREGDLDLTFVAPRGPSAHLTAVLLSGDGGWAELIRSIADGLAARGIAVVGVNSRTWLSSPKTPDETAKAIERAIAEARARSPGDRLLLVGYSRGADMAPFVATRLPRALRDELVGLALFGLAPMASFEFHWSDLVKDTPRVTDIPIHPELERLRGLPMVCVSGTEEKSSGCRGLPAGLMRVDERSGGHHFDGNLAALLDDVMQLVPARAPAP